tara:strand:+ start:58 stop:432 length:375 start_codon:yes stop_codon:yes gene_type:complete
MKTFSNKITLLLILSSLFSCGEDKKNGVIEEINSSGERCYTNYNNGIPIGEGTCFFYNGVRKSVTLYYNGKKERVSTWNEDGSRNSDFWYRNGLRHGISRSYKNDEIWLETHFRDGKTIFTKEY